MASKPYGMSPEHLLAFGAAFYPDWHVQNATDALQGFEGQMVFPSEDMDVPIGLNLHMDTGVLRGIKEKEMSVFRAASELIHMIYSGLVDSLSLTLSQRSCKTFPFE